MDLDFNTLLCVCSAATVLAAIVISFFGATQGTHRGFRWWVAAQWLLVLGMACVTLDAESAMVAALGNLLIVQWPLVMLAGIRRLHARKPPFIPPMVDWALLALAGGFVAIAFATELAAARSATAFSLAAFVTTLYSAVLISRISGFKRSFALKALASLCSATATLEALCLAYASGGIGEDHSPTAILLTAQLPFVVLALSLVPIAIALTYERTVAKMRAAQRKLRHLAEIDMLTRLPNRSHFHDLATRALAAVDPANVAVLMFDIENLKRINDLLGPASGDEALRQVGLALRETLRANDIAGRVGGDEFAAFLPDTTVSDAVRVAARLTERLEDRQVAPRTARLTLNIGAVQMRSGDNIVDVLRRADIALDDARNHRDERPVAVGPEERKSVHAHHEMTPKAV